jgi:hypothetical protein
MTSVAVFLQDRALNAAALRPNSRMSSAKSIEQHRQLFKGRITEEEVAIAIAT